MTEIYLSGDKIEPKKSKKLMIRAKKLVRNIHLAMSLEEFERIDITEDNT